MESSADETQHCDEMRRAATKDEQVPDAVRVAPAGVVDIKDDAGHIQPAAGRELCDALTAQLGNQRDRCDDCKPAHDDIRPHGRIFIVAAAPGAHDAE